MSLNETRIAVFSDSHGNLSAIRRALPLINLCQTAIFLGDGIGDIRALKSEIKPPVIIVRGNNDFNTTYDCDREEEILDSKFFITHGHLYSVKTDFTKVIDKARSVKADFCLFGHTHEAHIDNLGDLMLINPGSVGVGYVKGNTFVIIEKNKDSYFTKIVSN